MKTGYILVPVKIEYHHPDDETIRVDVVTHPSAEDCEKAYSEYMSCLHETKESAFEDISYTPKAK